MCELFGLSADRPLAGWELPLAAFGARGGETADNPDGWGIAWREGGEFRLVKAPTVITLSLQLKLLTIFWLRSGFL
jgi:glutamine amidotransferase